MKAEGTIPFVFAAPRSTARSLRGEIVTEPDQLFSLEDEWNNLVESNPSATVFQSFPWFRAWWRGFHEQAMLSTVVVRDGKRTVGILPLVRTGDSIRLLGSPGLDYGDILCFEQSGPEVLAAALRTLLRTDGWKTCYLSNLRNDSQIVRYAGQLPSDVANHFAIARAARRSALSLRQGRDEVIHAMRRKAALKRHRNKFYRQGDVRFRHLETREEARHQLGTLFEQHIWRRALAGERSQFLNPEWRAFYAALVEELNPRKELRFSVLELNGVPVACHFGFESRGRLILYKPTFDVGAWELSPGDVLLSELLAYAGEQKLDEVDFTIGSEPYKEHFTNESRDMFRATLEHDLVRAAVRRLAQPLGQIARYSNWRTTVCNLADSARSFKTRLKRYARTRILSWIPTPAVNIHVESESLLRKPTHHFDAHPARLNDLAELAIQQPPSFGASLLQEYRANLRRGDVCYMVQNSQHSYLLWMRKIVMPDSCEPKSMAGKTTDVLYDILTNRGQKASLTPDLARWFDKRATEEGAVPCVCVPMLDSVSRAALRDAHFEYRRDLGRPIRRALWQR